MTIISVGGHLFVSALLCGLIFAVAADIFQGDENKPGRTAGWINGADHTGAAVGAMATGAVFIPLFGITACLALGTGLGIAACALIFSARKYT